MAVCVRWRWKAGSVRQQEARAATSISTRICSPFPFPGWFTLKIKISVMPTVGLNQVRFNTINHWELRRYEEVKKTPDRLITALERESEKTTERSRASWSVLFPCWNSQALGLDRTYRKFNLGLFESHYQKVQTERVPIKRGNNSGSFPASHPTGN